MNLNDVGLGRIAKLLEGGTSSEEDDLIIFRSISGLMGGGSRYLFDTKLCNSEDGWKQYDTEQDAWYFGVWVHIERRLIVTYAEGDVSVVYCLTTEALKNELKSMEDFYGSPPPAFRVYDIEAQTKTLVYDERPSVKE